VRQVQQLGDFSCRIMNSVLSEVTTGANLKHVETADKAAPVIDANVQIKANPFKQVAAELSQPHELKHVEPQDTIDKSAPVIESNVQIKENKHGDLLSEIKRRVSTEEAA